MNYSNKSDREINDLVAQATGVVDNTNDDMIQYINIGLWLPKDIPDFCNVAEFAFPIMQKYGIGFNKYDLKPTDFEYESHKDLWWATAPNLDDDKILEDRNPLRASMVAFLILNQQGKINE
tara:strand:+ start:4262 stop:4624 length:363 start_codon:yes stop_codon:yes gene_type:complete